jgi:hypothetical protein
VNVQLLIDSIVRQTMVLIAELATSGGVRAPLAGVANQVFIELSDELNAQGVSRKVSADMFGMALRTYLRRIQRLKESSTDHGRSLWQAVLAYLETSKLVTRAEVLQRFHRDDAQLVRATLHDLVESGLVLKMGRGPRTAYRAATRDEIASMELDEGDGTDELVWAIVFREGPIEFEQLSALVRGENLEPVLSRLLSSGRVQRTRGGQGAGYVAREFVIQAGSERGWEAAVFDHFQAVVRTISARLRADDSRTRGALGGSTYAFDVWPGHPHEAAVFALLGEVREKAGILRTQVREHNTTHLRPRRFTEVTFYAGQTALEQESTEETDDADA